MEKLSKAIDVFCKFALVEDNADSSELFALLPNVDYQSTVYGIYRLKDDAIAAGFENFDNYSMRDFKVVVVPLDTYISFGIGDDTEINHDDYEEYKERKQKKDDDRYERELERDLEAGEDFT